MAKLVKLTDASSLSKTYVTFGGSNPPPILLQIFAKPPFPPFHGSSNSKITKVIDKIHSISIPLYFFVLHLKTKKKPKSGAGYLENGQEKINLLSPFCPSSNKFPAFLFSPFISPKNAIFCCPLHSLAVKLLCACFFPSSTLNRLKLESIPVHHQIVYPPF